MSEVTRRSFLMMIKALFASRFLPHLAPKPTSYNVTFTGGPPPTETQRVVVYNDIVIGQWADYFPMRTVRPLNGHYTGIVHPRVVADLLRVRLPSVTKRRKMNRRERNHMMLALAKSNERYRRLEEN